MLDPRRHYPTPSPLLRRASTASARRSRPSYTRSRTRCSHTPPRRFGDASLSMIPPPLSEFFFSLLYGGFLGGIQTRVMATAPRTRYTRHSLVRAMRDAHTRTESTRQADLHAHTTYVLSMFTLKRTAATSRSHLELAYRYSRTSRGSLRMGTSEAGLTTMPPRPTHPFM